MEVDMGVAPQTHMLEYLVPSWWNWERFAGVSHWGSREALGSQKTHALSSILSLWVVGQGVCSLLVLLLCYHGLQPSEIIIQIKCFLF